ncbi:hypothetical protein EVAR_38113_1 [Eumeta japonica]|uniref:Uncharacterized protein n=1 Tax=Eumeta variegata TaxID=151549 RepID=A0A4C1X6Z0_EUMVA|nr:hypothetical protein EVAR_38113_1 [Eumeta japonica]
MGGRIPLKFNRVRDGTHHVSTGSSVVASLLRLKLDLMNHWDTWPVHLSVDNLRPFGYGFSSSERWWLTIDHLRPSYLVLLVSETALRAKRSMRSVLTTIP